MSSNAKAVEINYGRGERREVNVLVRRPFYLNLRIGNTQNALWVGESRREPGPRSIFNWFPLPWSAYSSLGRRWSRRTFQEEIRRINARHGREDYPELADALRSVEHL